MDWEDARWLELHGGYGMPYDPRKAIRKLAGGDAKAGWDELWQELHHQGGIGEMSYAAVPKLVDAHEAFRQADWNTYALAATIEEARRNPSNPTLPDWLASDYKAAWRKLQAIGLSELPTASTDELIDSIIAVLAFGKGRMTLGRMAMLADDERAEMLDQTGYG